MLTAAIAYDRRYAVFTAAVTEIVFLHVFQFGRVALAAAAALATDIDFNRLLDRCTRRDGLATVISLCSSVAGCADAGQTLTGVRQTPTAGEMAARVAALAAPNKVSEAIGTGEPSPGKRTGADSTHHGCIGAPGAEHRIQQSLPQPFLHAGQLCGQFRKRHLSLEGESARKTKLPRRLRKRISAQGFGKF